jgi:hypothetical protein
MNILLHQKQSIKSQVSIKSTDINADNKKHEKPRKHVTIKKYHVFVPKLNNYEMLDEAFE